MKTITTLKRSLVAILAVAILLPSLQSCKKTVTPKKLDGEWDVTAGTGTSSYDEPGYSSTTTSTYDGAILTSTTTSSGTSYTSKQDKTINHVFDKKAGTFTTTTVVKSSSQKNPTQVYPDNTCSFMNGEDAEYVTTTEATYVDNGIFSVSGGSGEIEKNTRVVFQPTGSNNNTKYTYAYFTPAGAALNVSGKFTYDGSSCVAVKTTETIATSSVGTSSYGSVWTVESLKKGEMVVKVVDQDAYTSSGVTETSKSEWSWTLTEKE